MHDYDISWDYVLDDKVEKKHVALLKKMCKDIKKDILPVMKAFKKFEVYPIVLDNGEGVLGVFCSGTSSVPVIGIDIQNHLDACVKYNTDFELALRTTILHELQHAWQEYNGEPFDEEKAENFAFMYA